MAENVTISTEAPLNSFNKFINQADNKRIFFSGEFGSGKTFFLNDFFQLRSQNYDSYHLYPMRYQILSNEDVMNLMRYDILTSVIERYPNILKPEEKLPNSLLKKVFKNINYTELAREWLGTLPKIGRPIQVTEKAISDALAKVKEAKRGKSQVFAQKFKMQVESGYLVNTIDSILRQCLKQAKMVGKDGGRKSVLIVDDLDRMDPEHVFRILNVFSAKIEPEEANEWYFDHVILVGDIKNIEHIFHHKYGPDADFNGYFDKFVSRQPYIFNNALAVIEWIQGEMFHRIKYSKNNVFSEESIRDASGTIRASLEGLLQKLFEIKAINLKQLLKPTRHELRVLSIEKMYFQNPPPHASAEWPLMVISFSILVELMGGKKQ